jgi:myo-inositol-1(or 4)-monophosphatase
MSDGQAYDETLLDELLALAERLARSAGELLVQRRPTDLGVAATKSSPTDIVTEMDTAAEALIVEGLRTARPGDGVLGEEGASDEGTSGVRWVIDPIDGTVNYLYSLPAWAVSIAAEIDGRVVVGVVHIPPLGETYTAVRGRGARCNGRRLSVRAAPSLEKALVGTGFGYERSRRARQAQILTTVLPAVRDVRRGGAASVDLCSVAAGRLDAYYERGLQPWDLAAGGLVAEEAGARVGGLDGRPAGGDLVIAGPPGLFDALHDLLRPLRPDTDG